MSAIAEHIRARTQRRFRAQTWDVWRAAYNAAADTYGRKTKVAESVLVSVYPSQTTRLDGADDTATTASVGSGFCALSLDIRQNDTLVPAGQAYKLPSEVTAEHNQHTVNAVNDWPSVRVLKVQKDGV